MAKTKAKSKKELLIEQIAAAVGAGREVVDETVDFSDPTRPKTCLEVDFPIIPINQIATNEGNSGKPIYQMSKWWARRRSSVFRSMLLAAATKAPEDESQAAKAVWNVYYANHQKRGSLRHLKVADPFMGGGTTIVEGSRLGMQMFGCDLNPVAWFVVKNEMAEVDIAEVKRLLADIEAEVKPQIMPYYACDGPNGEKGKWFQRKGTKERKRNPVQMDLTQGAQPSADEAEDAWEELPDIFDIFSVPWQERKQYRYEGPEIIYTFFAKHGPCQREGCGHRTPIMSTPIVATKILSADCWADRECSGCHKTFDVERYSTRMAPDSPLFVVPDEKPFATMDDKGRFACPHCGKVKQDERALADNTSPELGRAKSKKVELTLLIHPQWLQGCPKHDDQGREHGGSATDSVESTVRWNNARAATLRLLEVRGTLPEQVTCPETKVTFYTDRRGGTVPKKSTFACAADGSPNDVLTAIKATSKTGPKAAYVIQGYSPAREAANQPYSGRFFAAANDPRRFNSAILEWEKRKQNDLGGYWPVSEVPFGFMTHMNNGGIPNHGYTHWWTMFNPLQLLIHSQLLKAIADSSASEPTKEYVLGAFQQYLRNQNMFCIWDISRDCMAPHLSNNNYHPKSNAVENCVFPTLGRGNWTSCTEGLLEGFAWTQTPWEPVVGSTLDNLAPEILANVLGKSVKVELLDKVSGKHTLVCGSATELHGIERESIDAVITDPPFGGLLHYSELSDFFYVWLRLALRKNYPDLFEPECVPKALEAVANRARHPENADAFYQRILTDCWRETYRVLKPGGILAFTFHHSEDEPWVGVLESLFDAGFYLEATYPIRSDETKGEGAKPGTYGSMTIEYDIIHVCRKRIAEPQPISWARLRRLIVDDVQRIKNLLSQHRKEGLPAADLQVIKRGKALEYFSRHYGKVYIEQGREFTIREALVGINQLLDDDTGTVGGSEAPPSNAEPYTRQFFRIFYETTQIPRDQMQKFLRGTGIAPSDFQERGWCSEKNKVFVLTPPVELARTWKGLSRKGMARDFDQTMFLVGACIEGSNIRVIDTLESPHFTPHPATAELVDWLGKHGGSQEIKFAAQRARTIYRDWMSKNKAKVEDQMKLFDLEA
jgi:putative DNA methylase